MVPRNFVKYVGKVRIVFYPCVCVSSAFFKPNNVPWLGGGGLEGRSTKNSSQFHKVPNNRQNGKAYLHKWCIEDKEMH